jgi:hypothetical protein
MSEVQAIASPLTSGSDKTSDPVSPKFGIRMQYKNDDRTIELPLDTNMVGRLCIEAEFRNTKIGELLARLIKTIAERDLFELVLETPSSGRISQSFQLPS